MLYGDYVIALARRDKCNTQSRSKNGKNYVNKYNKMFAGHGGIDKEGHMPRPYGYIPGHCTNGRNYWYCMANMPEYVPVKEMNSKSTGYFWNAHQQWEYWKKKHPKWCTTDHKKAVKGATAYKGQMKNGKLTTPTHTCMVIKTEGDYVWTVDSNVSGKYKGKTYNNGTVHKRHKKWFNGFVNFPKLTKVVPTDKVAKVPMKNERISCNYKQGGPHIACSTGTPCDYPTDFVGKDTGRDWAYNRFGSDMVVLRKYEKASHSIWLRSKNKVYTKLGYMYLYMMCEHQDNAEMKRVNDIYPAGGRMFREAANGNATGNHLHMSFGVSDKKITSKTIGSGWKCNSKKAWVMKIPDVKNVIVDDVLYFKKKK